MQVCAGSGADDAIELDVNTANKDVRSDFFFSFVAIWWVLLTLFDAGRYGLDLCLLQEQLRRGTSSV